MNDKGHIACMKLKDGVIVGGTVIEELIDGVVGRAAAYWLCFVGRLRMC